MRSPDGTSRAPSGRAPVPSATAVGRPGRPVPCAAAPDRGVNKKNTRGGVWLTALTPSPSPRGRGEGKNRERGSRFAQRFSGATRPPQGGSRYGAYARRAPLNPPRRGKPPASGPARGEGTGVRVRSSAPARQNKRAMWASSSPKGGGSVNPASRVSFSSVCTRGGVCPGPSRAVPGGGRIDVERTEDQQGYGPGIRGAPLVASRSSGGSSTPPRRPTAGLHGRESTRESRTNATICA